MVRIWTGLLLLSLGPAMLMAADGPYLGAQRYKSKAVFLPGIPVRNYRYHQYSPHAIAVSAPAIRLGTTEFSADPAVRGFGYGEDPRLQYLAKTGRIPLERLAGTPRKAKLFQFIEQNSLRIDHCYVSEMAMTLTEDGDYVLSFRADQNPRIVGSTLPALVRTPEPIATPEVITPAVRQTSQILRNRFFVSVRGYAARSTPEALGPKALAGPVVMQINFPGFWVERGQSLPVRLAGRLPEEQARYFDVIDRIEFEFFYEYQDGLKADLP